MGSRPIKLYHAGKRNYRRIDSIARRDNDGTSICEATSVASRIRSWRTILRKGLQRLAFYEEDIDECIVLYELLERGEPEFSICAALLYDYRGAGELRRSLETSLARHYEPYIKYMEARRKRLQNNRSKALEKDVYCAFSENKCITTGETEERLILGVYETADQAIAAIEYEAALQKKEMGYSVKLDISSSRDIDYRVIVSHTNSISGLCYEDTLWYEQTTYFSAEAPLGKYF